MRNEFEVIGKISARKISEETDTRGQNWLLEQEVKVGEF